MFHISRAKESWALSCPACGTWLNQTDPRPFQSHEQGELREIRGYAHVANLPEHIALRMAQAARDVLAGPAHIAHAVLGRDEAIGMGGGILLTARCEHALLGASALAARELGATLESGATLDLHAADQMLIYLALAAGPSRFYAQALSSPAETALWLIRQFLPINARVEPEGRRTGVTIAP